MSGSSAGLCGGANKFLKSGGSGTNDGDLISDLPDGVMSHILSCLPTTVRTCVLSKEWEYKWTSIYNITVDDRVISSNEMNNSACFIKFMDRVLLYSQNVRSFHLSCGGMYDVSCAETWISAAFRRNVESVKLSVRNGFGPGYSAILSRSLLNCTSLRELEIHMSFKLKLPGKCCFPNLTHLYLNEVQIQNDHSSSDTLTFTFPVLVTLDLTSCSWLNVRFVEIYAPALISFLSYPFPSYNSQVDGYQIKIFEARLRKFEIGGAKLENILFTGSTVISAAFHHYNYDMLQSSKSGLQIMKLLEELSSIRVLTLSSNVAMVIGHSSGYSNPIPKFDKLEKLTVSAGTNVASNIFCLGVLFDLLHGAPLLNYLVVDMGELRLHESDQHVDRVKKNPVPPCMVSHLETVVFPRFGRLTLYQYSLPVFVMSHCPKLKTMLFPDCSYEKDDLLKKLSRYRKVSPCLTIDVYPKKCSNVNSLS